MQILLTGNRGFLGQHLERSLSRSGHIVVGFDLVDGLDLAALGTVIARTAGCDAVVHCAVVRDPEKPLPRSNQIGSNLTALSNLLRTCEDLGINRLVNFSSVNAMGIFRGEAAPSYFPIDEDHPCRPRSDYGIGKLLGERLCELVSFRTPALSVSTVRPPGIWDRQTYRQISSARAQEPAFEWTPYWEYGAFVDVDDLCDLVLLILSSDPHPGHRAYLACADDITTAGKSAVEHVAHIHPNVVWKSRALHRADPYAALLSNARARLDFGWKPKRNWRNRMRWM